MLHFNVISYINNSSKISQKVIVRFLKIKMFYKNLILTGGSSEVGKSIISLATKKKFKIFFSYYKNKSFAEKIKNKYAKTKNVYCKNLNFNKEKSIKNFFISAKKKLGKIDFIINCASVRTKRKKFSKCTINDFQINLKAYNGTLSMLKNEINLVKKQKISYPVKVINFSSRVAITGGNNLSHYSPMKAALNLITLILAKENQDKKVLFNAICPGKIIKNRLKNKHNYVTPLNLSKKCMSIYFSKKRINGKIFVMDKN